MTHRTKASLAICMIGVWTQAAGAGTPTRATQASVAAALPAEALLLPADAQLLMGLAVRSFVASPLYAQGAQPGGPLRPTALDELRRATGLDGERDLEQLVVARGPQEAFVILAIGRLVRTRIEAAWNARPQPQAARSLAFLSDRALVIGSPAWVDAVARKQEGPKLSSNSAMMSLVSQVPAQATFWMVGSGDGVAQLTSGSAKSPSATALPLGLPALKSIVISGDVDPALNLSVVAEAQDETSARGLADMVNGFVALAALQAQRKPALLGLAGAVSVVAQGTSVRLTARPTTEMIQALLPRGDASVSPVPQPASAHPSASPTR
jgi:hypothetical protein